METMNGKRILVTGGAGFIGSHVVDALLWRENEVYCIDNFDGYYDPLVKMENLRSALSNPDFHLVRMDLANTSAANLLKLFRLINFDAVIHLAAKAGVRASIEDAQAYYEVNVKGTLSLLEFARQKFIQHFIFCSSSSVYGNNPNLPWRESDLLHQPISPYGATKLAAEELGQVYSGLYGLTFIALRLFTVYGPRQRPDLAIHRFFEQMKDGKPITLFGDGNSKRDYTYVADIVNGILAALSYTREQFDIFNLGNNRQVKLGDLVRLLEENMSTRAIINWQNDQAGDVNQTFADISKAQQLLDYRPTTTIDEGVRKFVRWKELQAALV
ncbi:GDP-mannose 4,6-dehydratase [Flavihumibacter solisilvae]|nr:GDP-mannose 4,6-dehydratase [Flavihumibacter solisilvae]